jgi:tight adherence protein C
VSGAPALAVVAGIGLGLGLWTLFALVPRVGAARLSTRVASYIADRSPAAREELSRRPAEPASVLTGFAAPAVEALRRGLSSALGGDEVVAARLRQAGRAGGVDRFRSRQLLAGVIGAGAGVAVAVVLVYATAASAPVLIAAVALGAAAGVLAPEQLLVRAARARQHRITDELPTVLEFLSLALSAGEGILDALRRVANTGNGELAREFGRVVAEINTGTALPVALTRCATLIDLPAFTRTVDQLVAALDRGTPLVDVLQAQAQDSRDEVKRHLLESAGRKEVAMLVPLVFLILPVTIAFAIFPATLVLQLGF